MINKIVKKTNSKTSLVYFYVAVATVVIEPLLVLTYSSLRSARIDGIMLVALAMTAIVFGLLVANAIGTIFVKNKVLTIIALVESSLALLYSIDAVYLLWQTLFYSA